MKIELSGNDLREIHRAVRDRGEALGKEAARLVILGRHSEAENLDATAIDLRERLATYLSHALGKE